jgi:hypothetical protein
LPTWAFSLLQIADFALGTVSIEFKPPDKLSVIIGLERPVALDHSLNVSIRERPMRYAIIRDTE